MSTVFTYFMQRTIYQQFVIDYQYEVKFTGKLFDPANSTLKDSMNRVSGYRSKILIYIDQGVAEAHKHIFKDINIYFDHYQAEFELLCPPVVLPGGEQVKNDRNLLFNQLERIERSGLDRHAYIIGIGGGAVLDFTGFLAAIAHRGIRHIRVPTTVLAQNDSGVGVKNGINLFGKKNLIGTFSPPDAVINDFAFIKTLDQRDWRAGIAEALKVALIKDYDFFAYLEEHAAAFNRYDEKVMQNMIYQCARLHLDHIAGADPFETGSARPLDFGHWAAHKLEQMSDYRLRHGEAVAIGMAVDVTYSCLFGKLTETEWKRILSLMQKLGFALYVPELNLTDENKRLKILEGLDEFRQHLGGVLTVMLLNAIGSGINVHEIDADKIKVVVNTLKAQHFEDSQ